MIPVWGGCGAMCRFFKQNCVCILFFIRSLFKKHVRVGVGLKTLGCDWAWALRFYGMFIVIIIFFFAFALWLHITRFDLNFERYICYVCVLPFFFEKCMMRVRMIRLYCVWGIWAVGIALAANAEWFWSPTQLFLEKKSWCECEKN